MIEVKVPATSANIGTGIDCMGIALNRYLTARFTESDHLSLTLGEGHTRELNMDENYVYLGAKQIFDLAGKKMPPINIHIETNIPISRGLGSSAAAVTAGIWGANSLLGGPFDLDTLIYEATLFEGHPDNVVPSALGGFTVSMQTEGKVFYHKLDMSDKLTIIASMPDYELPTSVARNILPEKILLGDVLQQIQRACFLVFAMVEENFEQLALATEDRIFTPARHSLIPGYDEVTAAAKEAGAICTMISGAGPSIIAFAKEQGQNIADAMTEGFRQAGISAQSQILQPDNKGIVVSNYNRT